MAIPPPSRSVGARTNTCRSGYLRARCRAVSMSSSTTWSSRTSRESRSSSCSSVPTSVASDRRRWLASGPNSTRRGLTSAECGSSSSWTCRRWCSSSTTASTSSPVPNRASVGPAPSSSRPSSDGRRCCRRRASRSSSAAAAPRADALNGTISMPTRCPPCSSVRARPGSSTSTYRSSDGAGCRSSTAVVIAEFCALSPVTTTRLAARGTATCRSDAAVATRRRTVQTRGAATDASAGGSGSTTTLASRQRPGRGEEVTRAAARSFAPRITTRGRTK